MWLPSSSHRNSRLASSGRPAVGQHQHQQRMGSSNGYSTAGGGGRTGDLSRGGGSAGGDWCGAAGNGRGRMSVPQRYNRSRERQESSSSSAGGGGNNGGERRASRHRNNPGGGAGGGGGGGESGAVTAGMGAGGGKLPSIGGGAGAGARKEAGDGAGGRLAYQKANQQYGGVGGGGKQPVVHEEGSEACGVCTIQVRFLLVFVRGILYLCFAMRYNAESSWLLRAETLVP